jgi:plastocyanin
MQMKRLPAFAALAAAALLPAAALADTGSPPARAVTIVITDSGFDQQAYTVGTTPAGGGDTGIVTIMNKGATTHTATELPGVPFNVGIGQINFFAGQSTNIKDFDTGGIGPGQSVTIGVPFPGAYQFTSATDCLNGNRTPRFNCSPVAINVVALPPAGGNPAPGVGTAVTSGIPGDSCARSILTPGTPPLCVGQDRAPGQITGSPTQGVGDTTVTIDDVAGYQPSVVYLKVGSTVTWVNKGQKYHGVKQKVGTSTPDGFHPLDAGALEPGQSYSYTFTCPPGATSGVTGLPVSGCTELVGPFYYLSNIGYDAVSPNADGFGTTYSSPGSNGSLYTGAVFLVP